MRQLRAEYEQLFRVDTAPSCSWQTIQHQGHVLSLLMHCPAARLSEDCCIIYFHGGGWIFGSPSTHADISGALSERAGLRVASVGYRLAPEHPAPAPIEDGIAVLEYMLSKSLAQGGCNSVILCGDSAGAAIALAVERAAPAALRGRILGVCSLYGGFGLLDSASLRQWGSRDEGLDADCVRRYWTLANVPGKISPYAIESLGGPSGIPVYILIAGHDPLKDDSLALVTRLERAGRTLVVDVVQSETHGFLHGADPSPSAQSALERIALWMKLISAPVEIGR